jgi:uncharacterized protein (DUF1778 family)
VFAAAAVIHARFFYFGGHMKKERKNERLQIRVTKIDRDRLYQIAKSKRLSLSGYVRDTLIKAIASE